MTTEQRVQALENKITDLLTYVQTVNTTIAKGFEKVDANFDKVNEKIDSLRGNSTSSIEKVEIKLDDLKAEITKINEVTSYEDMHTNLRAIK